MGFNIILDKEKKFVKGESSWNMSTVNLYWY